MVFYAQVIDRLYLKVLFTKLSFSLSTTKGNETLSNLNLLNVAKNKEDLAFWISVFDPKMIMDELLRDAGGGYQLDCHTQAHNIGRISYQLYGASVFKTGNSLCHSGYYHGAMEAFLQEKGTLNLSENMTTLCNTFDTNFGQFECYHGVGHGALAYEDYDLPKAIKLCKKLPDSFSQTSCMGGVFMENVVTADGKGAGPTHTTTWVSSNPHYPCNYFSKDEDVQLQCYHMQTSRMLQLFGNNFDLVLPECLKAPTNMQHACFRSFGRDAAGIALRNPQRIVELCSKISQANVFVDECVIGALNVIVDFWGENLSNQASTFCKELPNAHKNTCYGTLANRLPSLFSMKSKKADVCKTFEQEYQNLCNQL